MQSSGDQVCWASLGFIVLGWTLEFIDPMLDGESTEEPRRHRGLSIEAIGGMDMPPRTGLKVLVWFHSKNMPRYGAWVKQQTMMEGGILSNMITHLFS